MKKIINAVLVLALFCTMGCNAMGNSNQGDPMPVAKLLSQNLEQAGLHPDTLEKADNEHLKGGAYTLNYEGGALYLFAYANGNKAAEDLLDSVDQNGFFYQGDKRMAGKPHYFLRDNVVVFYLGEDSNILQILEQVCGPQLRGMDYQL